MTDLSPDVSRHPPPEIHLDLETRSAVDLRKAGLYVYAEDPTTDVWCAAWCIGDAPIHIWTPGQPFPSVLGDYLAAGALVYAHNAGFESALWAHVLTPRYGWPAVPFEQMRCTAAMAAAMALPRDLDGAAMAMGLDVRKDAAGKRLMLQLAKPRRVENGVPVWWEPADAPEKHARLRAYCAQDVEVERALTKKLRPLPPSELALFQLDHAINTRGVRIDLPAVKDASAIVKTALEGLDREIGIRTRNAVTRATQASRLAEWLREQGVDVESVDKAAVKGALSDPGLDANTRRVLEIRQEAAKSSTAKLEAYQNRLCRDGRMRENLLYMGASTGRWSGKGAQLQNLPRPALKANQIEHVFEALKTRDPGWMELWGPPLSTVADTLRGMIIAADGHELIRADFSNIEGRVLAWLAGEQWKLDAFSAYDAGTGPDLYKLAYSKSFGVPVEQVSAAQRQIGKVQELACIAEDELVLTDEGLVPIQEVTSAMRVWDGLSFVSHRGVIFRGIKEVLSHDGLRATADHIVWTEDGRQVPFGVCAEQQIALAQTGSGGTPVRLGGGDLARDCLERRPGPPRAPKPISPPTSALRRVWHKETCLLRQPAEGEDVRLPGVLSAENRTDMASEARRRHEVEVREPERCWVSELWRPRGGVSVPYGASGGRLHPGHLGPGQGPRTRQDRQRRPLRAGQPAVGHTRAEHAEQAWGQVERRGHALVDNRQPVLASHDTTLTAQRSEQGGRGGERKDGGAREAEELAGHTAEPVLARTYDIAFAGPRSRFTVSGRLVHNCGYQGGVGAFQSMATLYGIAIADEEADRTKTAWREAHPSTVKFWYALDAAAMDAVRHPGRSFSAGPISYAVAGNILWCRLPSGRLLAYVDPKIRDVETPWGAMRASVTYMGVNSVTRKWERAKGYGGLFAENVTQAVARDVMAEAMLRVEAQGWPVLLTVHDEVVCETPIGAVTPERFGQVMTEIPHWADGLPVAAEAEAGRRYGK